MWSTSLIQHDTKGGNLTDRSLTNQKLEEIISRSLRAFYFDLHSTPTPTQCCLVGQSYTHT